MKRLFGLLLLLAVCSSMAFAQDTSLFPEITVGNPGGDLDHPNYVYGSRCYSKIAPNVVVSNPAGGYLSGAVIYLGNAPDADETLSATVTTPDVWVGLDRERRLLTLSGVDTVENYMLMLRGVIFQDLATTPTPGMRTITIEVDDELQSANAIDFAYLRVDEASTLPSAKFQTDCAVISGGSILPAGTSHLSVWWAPVRAKGDIELLGLNMLAVSTLLNGQKNMLLSANSGSAKFAGAGISDYIGLERWLRWQCSGAITDPHGNLIFPAINGVPVTDFYGQLLNGQFGSQYVIGNLTLNGFDVPPTSGQGIYYDAPGEGGVYPLGNSAFVQSCPDIAQFVDNTVQNELSYEKWKAYAIATNSYLRPPAVGSQFLNQDGVKLWVTPDRVLVASNAYLPGMAAFTSLRQISMKPLLPADGNSTALPDRMLFIDTIEGTPNGTPAAVSLNSSDGFFWKGLIYVNGSLNLSGAGGNATLRVKNPDEYAYDPEGNMTGRLMDACFLDGVLYTTGQVTRMGNASVYGSYITKSGMTMAEGPYVYYNSRLKQGVFSQQSQPFPGECVTEAPVTLSGFGVE